MSAAAKSASSPFSRAARVTTPPLSAYFSRISDGGCHSSGGLRGGGASPPEHAQRTASKMVLDAARASLFICAPINLSRAPVGAPLGCRDVRPGRSVVGGDGFEPPTPSV